MMHIEVKDNKVIINNKISLGKVSRIHHMRNIVCIMLGFLSNFVLASFDYGMKNDTTTTALA